MIIGTSLQVVILRILLTGFYFESEKIQEYAWLTHVDLTSVKATPVSVMPLRSLLGWSWGGRGKAAVAELPLLNLLGLFLMRLLNRCLILILWIWDCLGTEVSRGLMSRALILILLLVLMIVELLRLCVVVGMCLLRAPLLLVPWLLLLLLLLALILHWWILYTLLIIDHVWSCCLLLLLWWTEGR